MDSYLEIAQHVLRASRRPMTALGILEAAYAASIVPRHLFGHTQEKTLQARLSEDILRSAHSAFFRTEPGYFFLYELMTDPAIPVQYKEKFEARRRTRDLHISPFLAVDQDYFAKCDHKLRHDWHEFVRAAETCNAIHYLQHKKDNEAALVVWTFSIVRRGTEVLSYRTGRYRNDTDTFANKRTIGFPGVVNFFDCTLFSDGDYGAKENALGAIIADLDISAIAMHGEKLPEPEPRCTLRVKRDGDQEVLLLVMEWKCPAWFEPTTRRLSLNDPRWLDLRTQNHFNDFEPWTKATLDALCEI
ncbi:hypothetical protein D3273_10470 [Lichenibacterium minor]|uniref:HTH HARE-type domain-containing protein n=1 Tax=Lichenibacterium minor TaxID=2316528 RepID=A0A4Q2U690_9HYPH|nr:HTH domain-containing protein [Lichenibacterium minor]RYC32133.1 hypothetical protein D3273_10470 [Lichenibacterium minor]